MASQIARDSGKMAGYAEQPIDGRAEEEERALAVGVNLHALRTPALVAFDAGRYRLRAAVSALLELEVSPDGDGDGAALEALQPPPVPPEGSGRERRRAPRGPSSHWISKWQQNAASATAPSACAPRALREAATQFDRSLLDFVREVVLPNIGDPKGILFQRRPTFRCHIGGGGEATGRPHCDAEYGHSRSEINYWLPLTSVYGSNSLYAESAPGAADFAPFSEWLPPLDPEAMPHPHACHSLKPALSRWQHSTTAACSDSGAPQCTTSRSPTRHRTRGSARWHYPARSCGSPQTSVDIGSHLTALSSACV